MLNAQEKELLVRPAAEKTDDAGSDSWRSFDQPLKKRRKFVSWTDDQINCSAKSKPNQVIDLLRAKGIVFSEKMYRKRIK